MVIVLNFDQKYYKWVPLLLDSYLIHEPEAKIALYTINLDKKQIRTLDEYSNVHLIQNKKMEFNPKIASSWLFQIVCNKCKCILHAIDHFKNEDFFINSDVDLLLIKPFKKLKKQIIDKDLGLVYISKQKILSGFIVINNTNKAIQFIKEYDRESSNSFLEKKKDQPVLAKLYNKNKNKNKFLFLGREYLDHFSKNESIMWSAHKTNHGRKGERFTKYKLKLKEMQNGKN